MEGLLPDLDGSAHDGQFPFGGNGYRQWHRPRGGGRDLRAGRPRCPFRPRRDLWYCDIQLTTGLAYFPFVRLALVRYQPNSLNGAHVSRVVVSDCTQTVPTRCRRRGPVHPRGGNRDGQRCVVPGGGTSGGPPAPISRPAGYMYAQFERQTPGLSDEMSWLPEGDEVALTTTDLGSTGLTLWSGSLTPAEAPGTYRVVVWEQQSWPSGAASNSPVAPRVVFLDAVPSERRSSLGLHGQGQPGLLGRVEGDLDGGQFVAQPG